MTFRKICAMTCMTALLGVLTGACGCLDFMNNTCNSWVGVKDTNGNGEFDKDDDREVLDSTDEEDCIQWMNENSAGGTIKVGCGKKCKLNGNIVNCDEIKEPDPIDPEIVVEYDPKVIEKVSDDASCPLSEYME